MSDDDEAFLEAYNSWLSSYTLKEGDNSIMGRFQKHIEEKLASKVEEPADEHEAALFRAIVAKNDTWQLDVLGRLYAAFVLDHLRREHPEWLERVDTLTKWHSEEQDDAAAQR